MDDAKIVELYWARSDAALTETARGRSTTLHRAAL